MTSPLSGARHSATAAVLAVSLTAVLAACGGGSSKAAARTSPSTSPSTAPSSSSRQNPGGGSFSGATGSVAAITGSSMEVQNPSSGQTTVDWTGSTAFDQTVNLTAAALAPGDCVTVTGSTSNGRITARSVAVTSAPASGSCSPGFRPGGAGGPGGPGTGGGGRAAGGVPGGRGPTGSVGNGAGTGGRFANAGFASGKVVSASATNLVLFGSSFTRSGSRSATSSPPTTAAPADVTVVLDPSTTYTQVRQAAASDLAVGDCVIATGPADSTGAVTARTIRIASTGGQSCPSGFGRFGGGGAPSGAGANA